MFVQVHVFVEFYNLIERAALQYDCGILSNFQCIICYSFLLGVFDVWVTEICRLC
jgi:hypothetical protein